MLGQPTQTDQKDVPYRVTSCSAIKAQGKREAGGHVVVMTFVFPSVTHAEGLLLGKQLDTRLPMGGCE